MVLTFILCVLRSISAFTTVGFGLAVALNPVGTGSATHVVSWHHALAAWTVVVLAMFALRTLSSLMVAAFTTLSSLGLLRLSVLLVLWLFTLWLSVTVLAALLLVAFLLTIKTVDGILP